MFSNSRASERTSCERVVVRRRVVVLAAFFLFPVFFPRASFNSNGARDEIAAPSTKRGGEQKSRCRGEGYGRFGRSAPVCTQVQRSRALHKNKRKERKSRRCSAAVLKCMFCPLFPSARFSLFFFTCERRCPRDLFHVLQYAM